MNKKIMLVAVFAAVSLAGCGGGGSGASSPTPSVSSTSVSSSSVSSSSVSSSSEAALSSSVMSSSSQLSSSSAMSSSSQSSLLDTSVPLPVPTHGFNLGNSLEAVWGYSIPSQAVYTAAAKAGFNAVRIPCAWNTNSDPVTHVINADYMAKVKQAVDWSIASGMHVVINVHWDNGWFDNKIGDTVDPAIDANVRNVWTQIATAFAGYDNHLLFAAANEPDVRSPTQMKTLQAYYQTFINSVRAVGGSNTDRWLVLQGGGDTSWFTTMPTDPVQGRPSHLMVEFHNYTPAQFTLFHDDPSWGRSFYFWGAAYHYAGNPTRNATWGEEGTIDSGFQQLKEQFIDKGVPVLVGEFQAAGVSSLTGVEKTWNNASVLYWNKYVHDSALAHGLSPFYWSTPDAPFIYSTGASTGPELVTVLTGGMAPPPPNGAPYAATNLIAKTASAGTVNLTWTASDGATSYNLYRGAQSGEESTTPVVSGITGTSYTDSGLNDGTTYYYQVAAVNNAGPSGFTAEAYATTPGVNPDPTKFNFETNTQHWSMNGAQITGIATSTAQHFAGKQSLAVSFNSASAGSSSLDLSDLVVPAGVTATFHVWVPAGNQLTKIQPYLQDYNWNWTSGSSETLVADAWNTLTITVPPGATTPLKRFGLQIATGAAWTGTIYIDSVDWSVVAP